MPRAGLAARFLQLTLAGAAVAAFATAWAQDRPPSTAGRSRLVPAPRPGPALRSSCAPDGSVCVHALDATISDEALARTLLQATAALAAYRALGLPAPLPQASAGAVGNHHVFLDPRAAGASAQADSPLPTESSDRCSAFTISPPPAPGEGCAFEAALARALAEATLLGLDGALHETILAMQASYLATLVAPCTSTEAAAIDLWQRRPELGFTAPRDQELAGTLLFPWYLDASYGTDHPAAVMTGLIAVSAQLTPPTEETLLDEPDVFDGLRRAARDRNTTLSNILLDFAVARAFLGDRSDGAHLPDTERYGALGRPRFEWSVPYGSLPRRLGPLRAIQATGATYLWLDLKDAPSGAALRFVADWEEGRVFRWALVKVDRHGAEVGRLVVPGKYGDHQVVATVADLGGLAGLIVIGTHLGGDDRSQPFDPDRAEAEPAALYTVTLASAASF